MSLRGILMAGISLASIFVVLPSVARAVEKVDPSFGVGGAWRSENWDVMVSKDGQGRLLLTDRSGYWGAIVNRLAANGRQDPTFGQGGASPEVGVELGRIGRATNPVFVEPVFRNGVEPVFGATDREFGRYAIGLAQLTERGRLAKRYFHRGSVLYRSRFKPLTRSGFLNALLPAAKGTTLIAGRVTMGEKQPSIARIHKVDRRGRLVKEFGSEGAIELVDDTELPAWPRGHEFIDLAATHGGQFLALGYLSNRLTLMKFNQAGESVLSYGKRGQVRLPVRSPNWNEFQNTNNLALDRVGAGYILGKAGSRRSNDRSVVLAVTRAGTVRSDFGVRGRVVLNQVLDRSARNLLAVDLVRHRQGVIVAFNPGYSHSSTASLVRLTHTGELDKTFGHSGVFRIPGISRATSIEKTRRGVVVGGIAFKEDSNIPDAVVKRVLVD